MHVKQRLPELDTLRGIAALTVAIYHYGSFYGPTPLGRILYPIYNAGPYMVDFFFVLSGFVLGRTYLRAGRDKALTRNIIERIARLYPLHFVTLILMVVIQYFVLRYGDISRVSFFIREQNDLYHFVLNLLLLNNIGTQAGPSFNFPAWSISVEFVVNFYFFIIILLPLRRGMTFVILAFLSAGWLFIALGPFHQDMLTVTFTGFSILRGFFGFFVGATLSLANQPKNRNLLHKPGYDILFLSMATILVIFMTINMGLTPLALLVVAVFPAIIWSAINGGLVKRFLSLPPLVYIGSISYSIYLIHFPLLLAVKIVSDSHPQLFSFDQPLVLGAFIAGTLGIASITYHLLERPAQKAILKRFVRRRKSLDAAASPIGSKRVPHVAQSPLRG